LRGAQSGIIAGRVDCADAQPGIIGGRVARISLMLKSGLRLLIGGIFLLYEPTRRADEDRAAFLDRFLRTNKPLWSVLTPAEWDQIWRHVTTCDFPETAAGWRQLGRAAGFGEAQQVFVDPTDFFRLFRFEG
jgi:hypothetical protein